MDERLAAEGRVPHLVPWIRVSALRSLRYTTAASSFFEKIFLWDADERRPDPQTLSAFVGGRRRPHMLTC